MGSKRKSRIYAMQALYAYELGQNTVEELLTLSWVAPDALERLGEDLQLFTRMLIQGTIEQQSDLDARIKEHLDNWDFRRIGEIDKAVLRLAMYEYTAIKTTPKEVIIKEAVGLVKEYGTDNSYKFVNGVLHNAMGLGPKELEEESPKKITLKRPVTHGTSDGTARGGGKKSASVKGSSPKRVVAKKVVPAATKSASQTSKSTVKPSKGDVE